MQEQCFFNRKSEIQIGFPELERINRIRLSEGEISKQISLKERGYSFNVICLKGVCALYLNSEKEDLELQKIEAIIFEQEVLYSRNLDHDKYYIRNRGEGETLVLILKIRA